ncbi:regulation of transcription from Pol II promoter-related protein [Trichosporon asahii var. asahii CBS 8904]|uniref:Regulation of transcription from Pol II promoter-related protein n=1 Tax=Trichosporon asahii var. asahii (strain CBS 8904) TaxID=1220162 RepID=K1W1K2_TRIAC|nr:regulation of transcription from Pol II promoter-related protein [Trichosporon asahii var. asahii CBS 8904]
MYGSRAFGPGGQGDMASRSSQMGNNQLGSSQLGAGQLSSSQLSNQSGGGNGGAGGAGPPLLLDNLAQHLNNPPAPSNPPPSSQANFPPPPGVPGGGNTPAPGTGKLLLLPNGNPPPAGSEEEKIYHLITELLDPETRETALLELSKKREMYEDLALVLWGGFGIMSSLLLEIVNVYPSLSPPVLTAHASNRVCNALALLQCVASHSETRSLFLNAHIPLFLYPFLNTTSKTRPFEYLRLTSLGVIGALVKQNDNSDVINFLLSTEIIPLCLRIMETGSELSKTVAIFIVQKILLDDLGLQYICQTYERFYAVGAVLSNMVSALVETQAVRLLKHVVRCYLRMSDNPRAREALRACLPEPLRDGTFAGLLKGDLVTKRCLQTLLVNLNERSE